MVKFSEKTNSRDFKYVDSSSNVTIKVVYF
jgi:hypothetical protein